MQRRSCAMTKKQYSTPKVSVGMVKKSIAAMARVGYSGKLSIVSTIRVPRFNFDEAHHQRPNTLVRAHLSPSLFACGEAADHTICTGAHCQRRSNNARTRGLMGSILRAP